MENVSTEQLAADTMLDIGVRFPIKAPMFLRLMFIKTITLTIKQPHLGTCLRAESYYLKAQKIGIDAKNITEALIVRQKTARLMTNCIAVYVLRSKLAYRLFGWLVSAWILDGLPEKTILNMVTVAVTSNVEVFMITIRLTAHLNMMKPNLSPKTQRS